MHLTTQSRKETSMARKKVTKEEVKEKDPRQLRWEKLVEAYAVVNPVKYAEKKAAGKFDRIPDSFQ